MQSGGVSAGGARRGVSDLQVFPAAARTRPRRSSAPANASSAGHPGMWRGNAALSGRGGEGPLGIEWHCFVSVSGFLARLGWRNKEGFMQDKSALSPLMRSS